MATTQPTRNQQVSHNRTAESAAVSIGMVLVIIFLAYLTHKFQSKLPVSMFTAYSRRRETQPKEDAENAFLSSMPIVKYGSNLQWSEPYEQASYTKTSKRKYSYTVEVRRARDISQGLAGIGNCGKHKGARHCGFLIRNIKDKPSSQRSAGPETEQKACSICTEDFKEGEAVRILSCGHMHHRRCVDPWLLEFSGTCPMCRLSIFAPPPGVPTLTHPERAHITGQSG